MSGMGLGEPFGAESVREKPLPAAGWFADPAGSAGTRWWDGAQWTDHTRPLVTAPVVAASAVVEAAKVEAGWYPDPDGLGGKRWWSGDEWGRQVPPDLAAELQSLGAAQQSSAQIGPLIEPDFHTSTANHWAGNATRSGNTTPIWIMACLPLISFLCVLIASPVLGAGFDAIAIGLLCLPFVLFVVLVVFDRAALQSNSLRAPSLWWLLLPNPIVHLIVRRVTLKSQGVISNAPSNVFVVCAVAVGLFYRFVLPL
jgi:Protein of unknown function (DUF2510)